MKTSTMISICILIAGLVACAPAPRDQIAASLDHTNVVSGQATESSELIAQSTVYLEMWDYEGKVFVSTGEVLAPQVILTAGHCVIDKKDPGKKYLLTPYQMNVVDRTVTPARYTPVEKAFVHPLYFKFIQSGLTLDKADPTYRGRDLALILLKKPLPANYKPVHIARDLSQALKARLQIGGFGIHSNENGSIVDGVLRHGPIQPSGRPANTRDVRLLRFLKTSSTAGLCHGDSGGPIYYEKDGAIELVAVNASIASVQDLGCAVDGETEYATLLQNDNLQFVADTYRQLTGQSLLEEWKSPASAN